MADRFMDKRKRGSLAIFVICFFLLHIVPANLPAQQSTTATPSKSCLWLVENSANRLYLLGSLHVLKSDAYPLAEEIDRAYTASRRVVFETDLKAMMEPAIQAKMIELGLYPEGQDLFQHISDGTKKDLENKLKELGLPPAQMRRFKPWFLAITLTTLELQRLGFNPLYGVDIHFHTKAETDNKELSFLEPVEYQLDLLGRMTESDQKSFLIQTLKDLEISAQLAGDMMTAWQKGDADKLYRLLSKSFEDHPNIEERLLTRRNRDWILKIEDMLNEPKTTMVIVGAGHLIGPAGIVELLKQKGYSVKQK